MTQVPELPDWLAALFSRCSAEVQVLERGIKSAITKDVRVFANSGDQVSLLETLQTITLGQADKILNETSTHKNTPK